jgi:hypothetical protein
MKQLLAITLLSIVLAPAAVHAQPYVAGSLSADIVRTGSSDTTTLPGSGEAFSFSLRAGAQVTPLFGIELDFTRPSEIETTQEPEFRTLDASVLTLIGVSPPSLPILGYRVHTAQRATTVTASAWARQDVSPRFAVVYLGGIAFARVERSVTTTFDFPDFPRPVDFPVLITRPSIFPPSYQTTIVDYTQGPMAGIEGRLALTEHVQLAPGFRLLGIGGGWVMRPAVGLGWTF